MYQKAIQAFFRKKTTYVYLIITIILLTASITMFAIKNYIENWIELQMEEKDYLRTMVLNATSEEKQEQIEEAAKEISNMKYVEEVKKEYRNYDNGEEHWVYFVTIDHWKHIDQVKNQVDKMGFYLGSGKDSFEIQIDNAKYMEKLASFVHLFMNALTTILILLFGLNLLKDEQKDNLILKATGYSKNRIWKIMLLKILLFMFIAYILAQTMALSLAPIIDTLLSSYGMENYKAYTLSYWNIRPLAYISLLVVILGAMLYVQIGKMKYSSNR